MADLNRVLALSTLPEVSALGLQGIKAERAEQLSRAKRAQLINLGNGILYDPNREEAFQPDLVKEALEKKRAHERQLFNTRLNASATTVPSSTKTTIAETESSIDQFEQLAQDLENNPDTINVWEDTPIQWLRDYGFSTAANIAEGMTKSDIEKDILARGRRTVSQMQKDLSGANLTLAELGINRANLPFSSGTNTKDNIIRLRALADTLRGQRDAILSQYGYDLNDTIANIESGLSGAVDAQSETQIKPVTTPAPNAPIVTSAPIVTDAQQRRDELEAQLKTLKGE